MARKANGVWALTKVTNCKAGFLVLSSYGSVSVRHGFHLVDLRSMGAYDMKNSSVLSSLFLYFKIRVL